MAFEHESDYHSPWAAIAKCTVRRLMRQMGLKAESARQTHAEGAVV